MTLSKEQSHYVQNVMRMNTDDDIRLFNGTDGEWLASLNHVSKKQTDCILKEKVLEQPIDQPRTHLICAPLKNNRMSMIIEKCTELGITDFHPVITKRTEIRSIRKDRIEKQIIEACEQSERLDIPKLHEIKTLEDLIQNWEHTNTIHAALERTETKNKNSTTFQEDSAFLVGPIGGFTNEEHNTLLKKKNIKELSLGHNILRAETAAIMCAALALNAKFG